MQTVLHYLIQHLDTFIGWLVTLLASSLAALIPLIRRSRRSQERMAQKEAREKRQQGEQLLRKYAQEVLPASDLSKIQILHMAHPHKLEDLYVPLRVYPETVSHSHLDARLRKVEEIYDPETYLQTELDVLEQYTSGTIDPVEAIRMYRRMVIIGEPGAGKTTLLRHLALQSAQRQGKELPALPLYIELSRYGERRQQDLLDLLITRLSDFVVFSDAAFMKELISEKMRDGQVILLLDGLDETRLGIEQEEAGQTYRSLVHEIRRLASLYPSMPVLVAVRKAHYQHTSKLEGFHEVEVASFRPEDSQTFVKNWFQASLATSSMQKMRDLQARLEESLRIRTLISNPLLLTLAAIVYERYLDLPESRAEFYRLCVKECIEVLRIEWDARRDIKRPCLLSALAQLHLLQEIAWHFHTCGLHPFPLEELLLVIEEFLPGVGVPPEQAKTVLEQVASNNGLLQEQASGIYGFSHLTFQEYFAAQYLNVHRNEVDLLMHLHNPWWEQVALFYANMRDESWLLGVFLGQEPALFVPDTTFHTHLLLAGRCLAEKQPLIRKVSLRDEVVERLFDLLVTTPYALLRERAATTLAMIGGPSINTKLVNILGNHDPRLRAVRECVGDALGTAGERQLAFELVGLLTREPERSMRMVIVKALGRLGHPDVVPILLRILEQEQEDAYVKQRIALALAEFREDHIVEAFFHLLALPEVNPMVQRSMVVALGVLGGPLVGTRLLEILRDEIRDSLVRAAAAKALGKLGQAAFVPEMGQVLENHQDTIFVRQQVAAALGMLRPAVRAVSYLLPLLEKTNLNVEVKCSVAEALGMAGTRKVAHHLLRILLHKSLNSAVRTSLLLALGYLGNDSPPILEALQKLLHARPSEPELRPAILAALGMLGMCQVKEELLLALKAANVEQDMLLHMLHALGCLGHHSLLERRDIAHRLAPLLLEEHVERYIKENIAVLLKNLGESTVLSALFDLLENQSIDRSVRQHIAEFVGQTVESDSDVTRLNALLQRTDIADDIFRACWMAARRVRGRSMSSKTDHTGML